MANKFYLVDQTDQGPAQSVSIKTLLEHLKTRKGPAPIVTFPGSEDASVFLRELPRILPASLARQRTARQQDRIETILGALLDFDPLDRVEARIDTANAQMRRDFLSRFKVLDAAGVHDRAGHSGSNRSQTAASWSKAGRILGLPYNGKTVYPAFQFDADGQPWPLMRETMKALRPDLSAWQRAFWMVSPNECLDGSLPIDAVRTHDKAVTEAARKTRETVIG